VLGVPDKRIDLKTQCAYREQSLLWMRVGHPFTEPFRYTQIDRHGVLMVCDARAYASSSACSFLILFRPTGRGQSQSMVTRVWEPEKVYIYRSRGPVYPPTASWGELDQKLI
jgi:hypothetical protein